VLERPFRKTDLGISARRSRRRILHTRIFVLSLLRFTVAQELQYILTRSHSSENFVNILALITTHLHFL
jgi:hypothetical protein